MPKDKILHIILGVISCLAGVVGAHIYSVWGLGPLLAYTSTTVGAAYEAQQKIRGEGQVEFLDALATSVPGWAAWAAIFVFHLTK
jgi:hypothetical protein